MRFFVSNRRGFTFVELLVAVSILALLSSIVLANVNEARKKSRDAQRKSDIGQIQIAMRLYKVENDTYPDPSFYGQGNGVAVGKGGDIDDLIAPYISKVPADALSINMFSGISRAQASAGPSTPTPSSDDYTYAYVYDPELTCQSVTKKVLYVKQMELASSGNWSSVCGGTSPGTNVYAVILQ